MGNPLVTSIPGSVAGLNTNAELSGMDPKFALELDNWLCRPDALTVRGGEKLHVTNSDGLPWKSVFPYYGLTTTKLFATTELGIYDVTVGGAVGGVPAIALTKGYGQTVAFSTGGANNVYFFNGVDQPKVYNGAAWAAAGAGFLPAMIGGCTYRERIYAFEKDKLGFWYFPVNVFFGAASFYNCGSIFQRGGVITAMATWTIDGGNGPDDMLAVASSNGEIAIFTGVDPGVAADWNIVGVYFVGRPCGHNCFEKYGGDLLFLCENGLFPLSKALKSATIDREQTLSRYIQPTLASAVKAAIAASNEVIMVQSLPSLSLLLVVLADKSQYVMDSRSKGWSRLTHNKAGGRWTEYLGTPYAINDDDGDGEEIWKMLLDDPTATLDSSPIVVATAYSRFKNVAPLQLIQVRPLIKTTLETDGTSQKLSYSIGAATDFQGGYVMQSGGTDSGGWAVVGTAQWGSGIWAGVGVQESMWQTVAAAPGFSTSLRFSLTMTGNVPTNPHKLLAFDLRMLQTGLGGP